MSQEPLRYSPNFVKEFERKTERIKHQKHMREWSLDMDCRVCVMLVDARHKFLEEQDAEREAAPKRTHCSVCGDSEKSYRLEPGTGRCTRCMP